MINNFDTSSKGVNLELNIFYDSDLACSDFDDWLDNEAQQIVGDFFIVGDAEKPFWKTSELLKMKKEFLIDLAYEFEVCDYPENYTKEEIVSELMTVTILDYYNERLTWSNYSILIEHDYERVNGYSQGDSVLVINLTKNKLDNQSLENLFWSTPIYARLYIDHEEIFLDEHLKDQYHYDSEEIIEIAEKQVVHEKKAYIIEWLSENLPTEPRYI